jgi:hypothetical protein
VAITNGYCTLAQLKSAIRVQDAMDDPALELAIEAASRMIDAETNRCFFATTATRDFTPSDSYVVYTDDLASITTVAIDPDGNGTFDTTLATTDYQAEPLNSVSSGGAFPTYRLRMIGDYLLPIWGKQATVRVTGSFGFTPRPVQVTQACVLLAGRLWKRADAPFGVAGFGDMGAVRVSRTDPDVSALIAPFKKIGVA